VLDAQYFGIPQRRRRVFVIAIFDPVLANRSPSPLLPVAESLPGHLTKSKPQRKSITTETAASFGTDGAWWDGRDTAEALTTTSNEQRMPDKQRFQAVVETNPILIDRAAFNQGENAQYEPYISDHPIVPSLVSTGPHAVAISEPMLLDIQRVGDIRVYSEPVQSLQARMGTGGNSTPMLAYPIDTRNALRDPEKYDAQNRQGLGIGNDGDPMATLTSAHVNGVAVQYDGYNQRVNQTDVSLTIRIGRDSSDFIAQPTEPTMAVRRLTPLECERLMGWPDNHTLTKADGTTQADTHRYKQCGNGVASPVAQWIAKHILNI